MYAVKVASDMAESAEHAAGQFNQLNARLRQLERRIRHRGSAMSSTRQSSSPNRTSRTRQRPSSRRWHRLYHRRVHHDQPLGRRGERGHSRSPVGSGTPTGHTFAGVGRRLRVLTERIGANIKPGDQIFGWRRLRLRSTQHATGREPVELVAQSARAALQCAAPTARRPLSLPSASSSRNPRKVDVTLARGSTRQAYRQSTCRSTGLEAETVKLPPVDCPGRGKGL